MGVLRLLLAFSVVLGHLSISVMLAGAVAVRAFFAISGFYMALILHEKYGSDWRLFYENRLLRLYPTYAIILALACLTQVLVNAPEGGALSLWASHIGVFRPLTNAFLAAVNLLILGQDATLYLAADPISGGLHFVRFFWTAPLPAYAFMVIPPAWSISLELQFYLLAPVLARFSSKLLAALAAGSLFLRFVTHRLHLPDDPWNYRFFPAELCMFVLGMLAYRAYRRFKSKLRGRSLTPVALFVFATTITVGWLDPAGKVPSMFFLGLLVVAIPVLFSWSKTSRSDRYIGQVSYPLYLCHWPIIWVVRNTVPQPWVAPTSLLASLLISLALVTFVDAKVEAYRQARSTRLTRLRPPQSETEALPEPANP